MKRQFRKREASLLVMGLVAFSASGAPALASDTEAELRALKARLDATIGEVQSLKSQLRRYEGKTAEQDRKLKRFAPSPANTALRRTEKLSRTGRFRQSAAAVLRRSQPRPDHRISGSRRQLPCRRPSICRRRRIEPARKGCRALPISPRRVSRSKVGSAASGI